MKKLVQLGGAIVLGTFAFGTLSLLEALVVSTVSNLLWFMFIEVWFKSPEEPS